MYSINDLLKSRGEKCLSLTGNHLSKGNWYIAGSCIATDNINDIDVFPANNQTIPQFNDKEIMYKSKNATTIRNDSPDKPPIQFCNFHYPRLDDLCLSFDYSHLEAGVKVVDNEITQVYYSPAYVNSIIVKSSKYNNNLDLVSYYPLSSLVRLLKYHKREEINTYDARRMILEILLAVVKRGFNDYNDFKDQLDAVDLYMLPSQYDECEGILRELYELFSKEVTNKPTKKGL